MTAKGHKSCSSWVLSDSYLFMTPVAKRELGVIKTFSVFTGYVIFYSKDPILPDAAWATSVIKGNRLSTLIKDLDPNSAYFFKIQARNKEGVGPTTTPVAVTVPDGEWCE